jgi:hypothetical protein
VVVYSAVAENAALVVVGSAVVEVVGTLVSRDGSVATGVVTVVAVVVESAVKEDPEATLLTRGGVVWITGNNDRAGTFAGGSELACGTQVSTPGFDTNLTTKPVLELTKSEQASRSREPTSLRCPSNKFVATSRPCCCVNSVLACMILPSLSCEISAIARPSETFPSIFAKVAISA